MKYKGSKKSKDYQKMVEDTIPKPNLILNCSKAFIVGGLICCLGRVINDLWELFDLSKQDAGTCTSITLVFLGAFFTGFNLYSRLGQFSGAGSIIPITGFANSIVATAIEYKKEGYIMGVGAKMFIIAGPVIVFGVIASVVIGLIDYLI